MHKRYTKTLLALTFALGLGLTAAPGTTAQAQQNTNSEATKRLVARLETATDRFEETLDAALDRSPLNGTEAEDRIGSYLDELEESTDKLDRRADSGPLVSDVNDVLGDAIRIETFLLTNKMTPSVQRDWSAVKGVLDELARAYNVAFVWTVRNYPPLSENERRRVISRLEERADEFRDSFDDALDRSRVDGKPFEDQMNNVVKTFERSLDDLDNGGNPDERNERNVKVVLNNALAIDDYVRKYRMTPRARRDWALVKTQLDDLARIYNVAWVWTAKPNGASVTATDATTPPKP